MRLLLDTHVALWALFKVGRLAKEEREMIADASNDIFVSAANVWEIAVKRPLDRKDRLGISAADSISAFANAGYAMLDITADHAAAVETLPLIHADPFDRLLIAQALTEPMRLITHDTMLRRYSDTIICFA